MNLRIKALRTHYLSIIDKNLAIFDLYANNPVGVGEHPDIISPLIEAIEEIDKAKSAIETLDSITKSKEG